ncbi:MAG: ERF family protein [Prevotellaceae bacterium]|jgi:hypothetical protein|nr:ERF family protein [Prevotellaceae bacterium]
MNIFEKIQAVAGEVMSIEKDMTVGTGAWSYKAVSDLSVTKKVKEAEQKYKLISIPVKQELVHHEVIRTPEKEKERITYSFIIKLTTRFIDLEVPTDYIEVESFGHGLDSGDKGFGKASTYARKYALLNAYKIATGEDPDQEASKQQVATKNDEIKNRVVDYLLKNTDYLVEVLRHFNVNEADDLNEKQLKAIYNNLKKKGVYE